MNFLTTWISWKNIPSPPAYFCWGILDQKFPKHLEPDVCKIVKVTPIKVPPGTPRTIFLKVTPGYPSLKIPPRYPVSNARGSVACFYFFEWDQRTRKMHLEAVFTLASVKKSQTWVGTRGIARNSVRVAWGVFKKNPGVPRVTLTKTEKWQFRRGYSGWL